STALATSSEKLSFADSMAIVVGLGLRVAAMSRTPVRYLLAGERTPNVYLYPLLKIAWAAPLASTIGIPFFSAMIASVAVAALPYGPRMNCAFSLVISFCTRVA